jgi:hypothetical protein
MSEPTYIPIPPGAYLGLRWLEIEDIEEGGPVIAWLHDSGRDRVTALALFGEVSVVEELSPHKRIHDLRHGCTWPSRADWADDMEECAAQGITPEPDWVETRRERRVEEKRQEGVRRTAEELDRLGVPLEAGRREASRVLRVAGLPVGRAESLAEALRTRRQGQGEVEGSS